MADENKDRGSDFSEQDRTVLQNESGLSGKKGPGDSGPYLIVVEGPHQGLKIPLRQGDNALGRVMGSEILLEDQSVSRRHAVISGSSEGWTVEDMGSKNGTFVNKQKIYDKVVLGHGDLIQVGIYILRLITRPVPKEEEIKPPADWEGKTVMMQAGEDETATTAEPLTPAAAEYAGGAEVEQGADKLEKGDIEIPAEISSVEKKKKPLWWNILLLIIVLAVVCGGGFYLYSKFFSGSKKSKPSLETKTEEAVKPQVTSVEEGQKPSQPPVAEGQAGETGQQTPVQPATEPVPTSIPVFLDFASSPLPAEVYFQGQDYGQAPVKIQTKLDVDKTYTAEAEFDLKEIGVKRRETVTFSVKRDESMVPILFRGPIGVLKVMELPKDIELYLEGYFVYDPFNAKTAKVENVIFGKPVYIPYGKYVIELRASKELAGSGSYVKDIRYKREILVTEDSPIFELKVVDQDLAEFPVEIHSVPEGADVFVDANKVGKTPYKGIFPLGEHKLSLRKDGYFEYSQDLKMDMNILYKTEIELKTTAAGELINTGKYLMQKGQHKDAIGKLTDVFKQSPTPGETAEARYLIGSCFVYIGDLASAESYFQQALENEDVKQAAQLGLVTVFNSGGKKEQAVPLLVDVLINARDEDIKAEARRLFSVVSPLKSIIYVRTEPVGAKVFLNDKPLTELTPLIVPDLPLGAYRVHIEKEGFQSQDLNINLSVNEFNPILVNLKPVSQ